MNLLAAHRLHGKRDAHQLRYFLREGAGGGYWLGGDGAFDEATGIYKLYARARCGVRGVGRVMCGCYQLSEAREGRLERRPAF